MDLDLKNIGKILLKWAKRTIPKIMMIMTTVKSSVVSSVKVPMAPRAKRPTCAVDAAVARLSAAVPDS